MSHEGSAPVVPTRVVQIGDDPATDPGVLEAAEFLKDGRIVAFPTETVYGLGADARNAAAVERIFAAKERPADNPVIVHVASVEDADLASTGVDDRVRALARAFWPGPLTLVLPARPELLAGACRGLSTVAVRVPAHPVALALLRAAGIPIAAPSANVSGRPSPTRAGDVLADLNGRIPLILDGGPCDVGLESTVVDLTGEPRILRPGAISAEDIEHALGASLAATTDEDALRRSPGTRYRHYAPRAPLILIGPRVSPAHAVAIARARMEAGGPGARIGHVGSRQELRDLPGVVSPMPPDAPLDFVARSLYATLRDLDAGGVVAILAEAPAGRGLAASVADRLRHAASVIVQDDASPLGAEVAAGA